MSSHEFRLGTEPSTECVFKVTDSAYLKSPLRKFCNNQVKYGHIDETTGYLRILSFSGFSDAGDFASDLAKLEKALDTIFSDPNLKRLVIDVRCCSGGLDPYGLAIASRLTAWIAQKMRWLYCGVSISDRSVQELGRHGEFAGFVQTHP
jgi:hypothetical protein